jgi:hypothetical protein
MPTSKGSIPHTPAKKEKGGTGGLAILLARATRGLGSPSFDERSEGRASQPALKEEC